MSKLCMKLAQKEKDPLVYYVLGSVFYDIWIDFSDRPIYKQEIEEIEKRILKESKVVMDSIINDKDPLEIWENLNELLKNYLQSKTK